MRMPSRRIILSGLAGTLVLVGGAVILVGGDDEVDPPPTTSAPTTTSMATTTSTTVVTYPAPLTGLGLAAIPQRPALVVKIDNAEGLARPQSGLNQADIVFEERVEGGVTRFAAIFHSTEAKSVGPIRSGRTTDVGIVMSLERPLMAFSGANSGILAKLRGSNIVDVGYDTATDAYIRREDRRAPHNLYSSTAALWGHAPDDWTMPVPLFEFRTPGAALSPLAKPVSGVDVGFTGAASVAVTYRWDESVGGWARSQAGTPHVDEADVQIAPENLLVQYVSYVNTGLIDVSGSPVPEAILYGSGSGFLLTAGHAMEVHWERPGPDDPTTWTDANGDSLRLTPGRTWIHLVPEGDTALVP